MAIALGIDFEDITHTPAYRNLDTKNGITVDLPTVTRELLDLFDEYGVRVTFFVVSDLAEQHPETIREIAARGHEIASHTRTHQSLIDLDDDDLRSEIGESKSDLEAVIDEPVRGFRAPTCRIDDRAYRVLLENGYEYSSSVMPSVPIPGFYSATDSHATPARISTTAGELNEFPVTVAPGVRLPVSGAWIRLLGRRYTLASLRRRSRTGIVCTYSHPWEFRSMSKPLPFRCRYRTGEWMRETYEEILSLDRDFVTCSSLIEQTDPELVRTLGSDDVVETNE